MRLAHAARSLAAFFVLVPAFVACQSPSEDGGDGAITPGTQASEAETERDAKRDECAPDETPERVCKDLPDGNVECEIVCVPQTPNPPGCDAGTHPVKACKPADGPDEDCFVLCLPDDQPPPVDPDECGPGTHPEWICEGPTPPWPTPPWPTPVPPSPPDEPKPEPQPDPGGGNGGGTTDGGPNGGGTPGFPGDPNGGGTPGYPGGPGFPGGPGGGPGNPNDPGGQCKIVCLPDAPPPFPQCPPETHPEKICRFDPTTGIEECSLECLPGGGGGEPPPAPWCPDGSPGQVVCKDVGGKVVCEVFCGPIDLPLPSPQPVPDPAPKP